MFPCHILRLFFLLFFPNSNFAQLFFRNADLLYNGNLIFNGGAEILENGVLRLTNNSLRVMGHVFYKSPFRFKNATSGRPISFSTAFAFAIVPEYPSLGGHGFAFTLSPTNDLPDALPSQYLGLMNATDMGNFSNHVFAVEFDTVQDFEFGDINDNHIGIDINSMVSDKSVPVAYFVDGLSKKDLYLKSGEVIQAWIDYNSSQSLLEIRISPSSLKPSRPLMTFVTDLSSIVRDVMYVGFSASTGLLASTHYILGWSFSVDGKADSLSLSSLPSLPGHKKDYRGVILWILVSSCFTIIMLIVLSFYLVRRIRNADVVEAWELDIGPHRFSYEELKKATRGFRDKELLGVGGFGKVYRGTLPISKTRVAVKRISHESKQGLREFASEITSIGRLRHRNVVQLLGWCRKRGDLLLVYDFMAGGSLDKYLFHEPRIVLKWEQRLKVMKDVASGLLYLHEEWEQTVIHRDIKSGNVLLDSELNGRLGDFGLAKLYERGSNPCTTRVVGTLGYLAPELTRTGKPTASSDVFAFGALLLELTCGRRPIDPKALPEELILVDWVWSKWLDDAILDVMDPKLNGEFDQFEAVMALKLGMMCSGNEPKSRPSIRQVIRYLDGEAALPEKLVAPEAFDSRKVGVTGGDSMSVGDREDYLHSYSDSGIEKVGGWSSGIESGDIDIETGSASLLTLCRANECR